MSYSTKEIMKKYQIRLTKSLGQNFLTDYNVVEKIVDSAEVDNNDLVIEIGPGVGSMTEVLAKRAGRVVAIEIDKRLIPALTEVVNGHDNVEIINQDVLKVDFDQLISSAKQTWKGVGVPDVKVVANLPYYITTPIIMQLLENYTGFKSMVFMIQKEVAARMTAKPGGKDYGALSVAVQYYSLPRKIFDVSPQCFVPQPEVDSTVIRLDILVDPPVKLLDKEAFFKTVKAAFGQRRKTLVNALANAGYCSGNKEMLKDILKQIEISENQRGETLSIQQFASLSNLLTVR